MIFSCNISHCFLYHSYDLNSQPFNENPFCFTPVNQKDRMLTQVGPLSSKQESSHGLGSMSGSFLSGAITSQPKAGGIAPRRWREPDAQGWETTLITDFELDLDSLQTQESFHCVNIKYSTPRYRSS